MALFDIYKENPSTRKKILHELTCGFDKYILIDLINEYYDEIYDFLINKYEIEEVDLNADVVYGNLFTFKEIELQSFGYNGFDVSISRIAFKIEYEELLNTHNYFDVIFDLENILVDKHLTNDEKIKLNECLNTNFEREIDIQNVSNWKGSQTDFVELIKALYTSGTLEGKQTKTILELSKIFRIKVNNPNKLIQDLKERNNGSETLFLDRLKSTLYDFIRD